MPSAKALNGLTFKFAYHGQLTPPLPTPDAANSTKSGPVVVHNGILWQRGPYRSWWLRLGHLGASLPAQREMSEALDEAIVRAKNASAIGAAAYVGVPECLVEPRLMALLKERGFRYHHYHDEGGGGGGAAGESGASGEHIYYRWLGDPHHDRVPSYASSIEGVGALILSPDEADVLLVHEWGMWKLVTGAIDVGESAMETVRRESTEEVGTALDPEFRPVCVGGWHLAQARDRRVNDNFRTFVVRAASRDFNADATEVAGARWFPLKELLAIYEGAGEPKPWEAFHVPAPAAGAFAALPDEERRVHSFTCAFLSTYLAGKGLPVEHDATKTDGMRIVYVGRGWD